MADIKPISEPAPVTGAASPAPKPRPRNPVFKMMGLPALPRKLPSRNWSIFWAVTGSITTAIVYDKREKKRATAKWRSAVAPLATEPITGASQLPRKLTIYLEAPPGDGLRSAQDHFIEYAKPVLSASGLDWEFVQGRQQGDVRAAVAEKIRRSRRQQERPTEDAPRTDEDVVDDVRKKVGIPEYQGIKGDIVVGRHAWKEYVRGLHEGWLGSLDPPLPPASATILDVASSETGDAVIDDMTASGEANDENKKADAEKEKEKETKKPDRPPQPPPHNTTEDYSSSVLPHQAPIEFSPSVVIPFPHRLGFSHTFVRIGRFLNRRKLADEIGRDVAAACFAASREWREADGSYEQQLILQQEERDWPKSVWKPDEGEEKTETKSTDQLDAQQPKPLKERIWTSSMVMDVRLAERMRRFEMRPEDEATVAKIVVPEEDVEGWIKGSFRSVWRWGVASFRNEPKGPNVGNLDDD